MSLIKSISGIRGTIGGKAGEGLSPLDVVKFSSAYTAWLQEKVGKRKVKIVVGRDARMSGEMVDKLVVGSLMGMGADVINIGLASTPTTEIAVTEEGADGGIILTASHNPKQWNALKLLNGKGEFLNDAEGKRILEIAAEESFVFAEVGELGTQTNKPIYDEIHIQKVLDLKLVDVQAIANANFKVVFDGINSVGGVVVPKLLKALGVKDFTGIHTDPTGNFAHVAEPLPENLTEIAELARTQKAHVGIVVDPDVDRLAIVNEDGSMFGEEYTLVACADYVLQNTPGNTASNLSSSQALRDVTEKHGCSYTASAVGEVNVVAAMKANHAVIGGEGNGGIIYPESHYGRDALVGIALFLTHLAKTGLKCTELRATYPEYFISKNKIELSAGVDVDAILNQLKNQYIAEKAKVSDIDGVKIEIGKEWVILRKSNTEPIVRIYSESSTIEKADALAQRIIDDFNKSL